MIELRALGPIELRAAGGRSVDRVLAQPKRFALLGYLAASAPRRFHARDSLVALLWPDLDEERARAALRNAIFFLRHELGADVIHARGDEVAVSEGACWCDATEFDAALTAGERERALSLYRGQLLEGLRVSDAPELEAWLEAERVRLRRRAHAAATALSLAAERSGELATATRWCRAALDLDADDEETLRRLVSLLDRAGDRAGALREYDRFSRRLAIDLQVQPSPESRAIAARIRARAEGAPAQSPKSVLVMPFVNMGPDAGDEYFADGLTEELITDLSKLRALRVISRTSAMRLKGTEKGLRDIARELSVEYVLEGSVRRVGNDVRITAQLIDAANDTHLWADKLSGTFEDVLRIQETLSRTIVDALEVTLTPEESSRLASRPSQSPHAYDCYLRARQAIGVFTPAALDQAIHAVDSALRLLGEDPLLYAAKAELTAHYLHAGLDPTSGALEKAEECVARALALAPGSYQGHLARGLLRFYRGEFQSAVHDLKRVLAEVPGQPSALMTAGYVYALSGRESSARPLLEKLLDVDPLTPLNHCMPGFVSAMEGRPERAIELYARYCELAPESLAAKMFHAWILAWAGRMQDAVVAANRLVAQAQGGPFASAARLIEHAARGDRRGAAAAVTPELRAPARGSEMFSRLLFEFLALAGERDEALSWLENANRLGFINYPYLAARDRFLDPHRGDPRLQAILVRVRSRWESFEV